MVVKIRIRPTKKYDQIVVADSRNSRDGKYIEKLGYYKKHTNNFKYLYLNINRILYWIKVGAMLSTRVSYLFKTVGLYDNKFIQILKQNK